MNVNVLFSHITLLNNMWAISITVRIVVRLPFGSEFEPFTFPQ